MFSYIASSFAHYPISPVLLKRSVGYQVMLLKELSQDSDEYKFNLGEYYFLTGMKEKATVLLEEIIDSQPGQLQSAGTCRSSSFQSGV